MTDRYVELTDAEWERLNSAYVDKYIWDAYRDLLHDRIIVLVSDDGDALDADTYNLLLDGTSFEAVAK